MKVGRGGAQHGEGGALPRPSGGKMAEVEVLGEVEGEVRVYIRSSVRNCRNYDNLHSEFSYSRSISTYFENLGLNSSKPETN